MLKAQRLAAFPSHTYSAKDKVGGIFLAPLYSGSRFAPEHF